MNARNLVTETITVVYTEGKIEDKKIFCNYSP
jgi:hypothetical protein